MFVVIKLAFFLDLMCLLYFSSYIDFTLKVLMLAFIIAIFTFNVVKKRPLVNVVLFSIFTSLFLLLINYNSVGYYVHVAEQSLFIK